MAFFFSVEITSKTVLPGGNKDEQSLTTFSFPAIKAAAAAGGYEQVYET